MSMKLAGALLAGFQMGLTAGAELQQLPDRARQVVRVDVVRLTIRQGIVMLPPDEKMQCFNQSLPSDGREAPVIIYLSSLELTSASSVPSHTARDLHP